MIRLPPLQVPEYCKVMEESEIIDQAFPLIFAFDEIVALGYRENVNLAQIRTFTEMDSHEEKVYQAVRQVRIYNKNIIFENGLNRGNRISRFMSPFSLDDTLITDTYPLDWRRNFCCHMEMVPRPKNDFQWVFGVL